jgi:hypothetical protein
VLPFQDWAMARKPLPPTATQFVALAHDTPVSRLSWPTRSEACQETPFQTWTPKLTAPDWLFSMSSVRTQLVVLPQDTLVSEKSGTSAFCWCQLLPSQDIVSVPVLSMQNVAVGQEI